MDFVSTRRREATAPSRAGARAPQRTALAVILAVLVLLLLAAEAQAYVPGQLIWANRIGTSTSEAGAWAVAAGPNGATAIAGWKIVTNTQVPMVARYTAAGKRWVRTYTAPGYANDVAIDKAGNVYVAATVNPAAGGEIVVLKYDAAGVLKWATTPYNGGGGPDSAREIAVDGAGNVVVAGTSVAGGTNTGIVVLKYDWDGASAWAAPGGFYPSSDPDAGDCHLEDLALGATGDIYVAGSSEHLVGGVWIERARLIKFAGADGSWANGSTYVPKSAPSGSFESIAVRGFAVVAVGSIWDPAGDRPEHALVTKSDLNLAPTTSREWGVGDATEELFNDVVLDSKGNVYVTGDQWLDPPSGYDRAVTIKLSPSLGKILWKATYLPTSRDAEGWYVARDSLGSVFVAGVRENRAGDEDFLTMKYSPTGARKWLRTWSGGGPDDDEPNGMVLGTKGGVYVGGQPTGKGDISQAALLKYQR